MLIEVYTDGSATTAKKPTTNHTTTADKPGGWAYCIVIDGVQWRSSSGFLKKATNNVAEISAAVEGLLCVDGFQMAGQLPSDSDTTRIVLISDSQLVLKYATGEYQCKAIHLVPLYTQLRFVYNRLGASTRWVKGHSGDKYNEICDKLAKAARESTTN